MPADENASEVARLRAPISLVDFAAISRCLEDAYGEGLRVSQEGGWFVVHATQPCPA
jgi:hypothetical protein